MYVVALTADVKAGGPTLETAGLALGRETT